MHQNPFTAAIVKFMTARPKAELAEICFLWLQQNGMDRHKAAVEFAGQLHKDIAEHFNYDGSPEAKLTADLLEAALFHTNFYRVARALLDRYVPLKYRPLLTPSLN